MDINSSYITGSNINNSGLPNLPKQFDSQGNAFLSLLTTALEQNPEYIYMDHHNVLTEEQMTELANQYDPENMDGEQYKAFLEDLVNLGAISEASREKLKGVNMSMYVSGNSGENGQWVDLTQEEAEARFGKSGDTLSSAGNNLQKLLQALKTKLPQKEELDALSEITDTISAMRQKLGLGSLPESGPKSLMEQAKDINSELWINLRRGIIENAREKDELRKEEEKIKLLGAIIDNATGRNDPRVSAAVGVKLGMNADQEIFKAGYMPSELHTYLLSLSGGKTTFEMVEDEEEREDGKVTGVEGAASDKLHTAHKLPDDKLLDMAENFDPNNMPPEQ
ncbi:MAG: hypothetical protein K2O18_03100, partial [Oscillospiraceae bacterium]|nr:hypothetical protein [Oscillospiraceae bacterium]